MVILGFSTGTKVNSEYLTINRIFEKFNFHFSTGTKSENYHIFALNTGTTFKKYLQKTKVVPGIGKVDRLKTLTG